MTGFNQVDNDLSRVTHNFDFPKYETKDKGTSTDIFIATDLYSNVQKMSLQERSKFVPASTQMVNTMFKKTNVIDDYKVTK